MNRLILFLKSSPGVALLLVAVAIIGLYFVRDYRFRQAQRALPPVPIITVPAAPDSNPEPESP